MTDQPRTEMRRSPLVRFLGGHPLSVLLKLLFISLVVGFVMRMFGFDALDLLDGAVDMVRAAFRDGFGLFHDLWAYVVTGAALVVPIWLLIRLSKAR